jgi:hypothetical protein
MSTPILLKTVARKMSERRWLGNDSNRTSEPSDAENNLVGPRATVELYELDERKESSAIACGPCKPKSRNSKEAFAIR